MIPMTHEQHQSLQARLMQLGYSKTAERMLAADLASEWWHVAWIDDEQTTVHTVEQWHPNRDCTLYLPVQGNVSQTVLDVFLSLFLPF